MGSTVQRMTWRCWHSLGGYRLEDIATAIQLWHGDDDVRTPRAMGHYMASALPACQAVCCIDEGHGVFFNHWREILVALLSFRTGEDPGGPWWVKYERMEERLARRPVFREC